MAMPQDIESQVRTLGIGWLIRTQLNYASIAAVVEDEESISSVVQAEYENKYVILIATNQRLLVFGGTPSVLRLILPYTEATFIGRKAHSTSSTIELIVNNRTIIFTDVLDTRPPTLGDILQERMTAPAPEGTMQIHCPRCGSTELTANQKGFGLKKAVAGGVLLGPVGLLGGFVGSKKVQITCLRCGHTWKPGA